MVIRLRSCMTMSANAHRSVVWHGCLLTCQRRAFAPRIPNVPADAAQHDQPSNASRDHNPRPEPGKTAEHGIRPGVHSWAKRRSTTGRRMARSHACCQAENSMRYSNSNAIYFYRAWLPTRQQAASRIDGRTDGRGASGSNSTTSAQKGWKKKLFRGPLLSTGMCTYS